MNGYILGIQVLAIAACLIGIFVSNISGSTGICFAIFGVIFELKALTLVLNNKLDNLIAAKKKED